MDRGCETLAALLATMRELSWLGRQYAIRDHCRDAAGATYTQLTSNGDTWLFRVDTGELVARYFGQDYGRYCSPGATEGPSSPYMIYGPLIRECTWIEQGTWVPPCSDAAEPDARALARCRYELSPGADAGAR